MYKFDHKALCLNMDTNLFFDTYEEDKEVAKKVDLLCIKCPAQRQCLAYGVSNEEWGVWGGVYLENGKISREFNKHRSKADWAETWQYLTMDN